MDSQVLTSSFVKYFRACYQADNRDVDLTDFLGSKVEHRLFFEQEEKLANGLVPYLFIDQEKGDELQRVLELHHMEREYVYGTLFIAGEIIGEDSAPRRVCAPLVLYEAGITDVSADLCLEIDDESVRINSSLIMALQPDRDLANGLYEELTSILNSNLPLGRVGVDLMTKRLREEYPELDADEMLLYPSLLDEKKFRKMIQPAQLKRHGGLRLLPVVASGMVRKSTEIGGLLTELSELSNGSVYSKALSSILHGAPAFDSPPKLAEPIVPCVLSAAQNRLFSAAVKYPLSVIIGPPGTGKSYTIAALATEFLSRGKSVLIAARTDQALDVIEHKLEKEFSLRDVPARGGSQAKRKRLTAQVNAFITGAWSDANEKPPGNEKRLLSDLRKKQQTIHRLENDFLARVESECDWGRKVVDADTNPGFFRGIMKSYALWRASFEKPIWFIVEALEKELGRLEDFACKYIHLRIFNRRLECRGSSLKAFRSYVKGVNARTGARRHEHFGRSQFGKLTNLLPLWLVRFPEAHRLLPLEKNLFDVVIVDEATQCDMATCLPVLQRARQVVVAGDPCQLRHVSFLSGQKQNAFRQQFGLDDTDVDDIDYRRRSLLDFAMDAAESSEQIVFLNEHFRSVPDIIRFSNKQFYLDKLRVMTERPKQIGDSGVELVQCQGTRTEKGFNRAEAEWIVKQVRKVVNGQKSFSLEPQSIGILSPFRDQVDYLSRLVTKEFTMSEISSHRLIVGTAYGFQGEERDIMFLSFAVDSESHPSAFRHLTRDDVFNVAITRARRKQYVCISVEPRDLPGNSLLRDYVDSLATPGRHNDETLVQDLFLEQVVEELAKWNLAYWSAFTIAGETVDLVVQKGSKVYGIDLIGYPGDYEGAFTMDRYKMLTRAGVRIFPLAYTFWATERETCLETLKSFLGVRKSAEKGRDVVTSVKGI